MARVLDLDDEDAAYLIAAYSEFVDDTALSLDATKPSMSLAIFVTAATDVRQRLPDATRPKLAMLCRALAEYIERGAQNEIPDDETSVCVSLADELTEELKAAEIKQ